MTTAANIDLSARVGATFSVSVGLWNQGDRVDLTGKSVRARLASSRDMDADPAPTQPTVSVVQVASGIVRLSLPATHGNPAGVYWHQVDLVDGNTVTPLLKGQLTVLGAL